MLAARPALSRWLAARGLAGYGAADLRGDLGAGLTLTALLVPAGMGYATAAGLPPETGLYASIAALVAYALVGPSRVLVLGPDSSLAPLIGAAIVPLVAAGSLGAERRVAPAGLLALLVGLVLVVGGALLRRVGLRPPRGRRPRGPGRLPRCGPVRGGGPGHGAPICLDGLTAPVRQGSLVGPNGPARARRLVVGGMWDSHPQGGARW